MLKLVIVLQPLHHPFTAPNPEDMEDLSSARALAYDMVYNGVEVSELYLIRTRVSCVSFINISSECNVIISSQFILIC